MTRKRPSTGKLKQHAANVAETKLMKVLHEDGAHLTEEHEEAVSKDAAVPGLLVINPGENKSSKIEGSAHRKPTRGNKCARLTGDDNARQMKVAADARRASRARIDSTGGVEMCHMSRRFWS